MSSLEFEEDEGRGAAFVTNDLFAHDFVSDRGVPSPPASVAALAVQGPRAGRVWGVGATGQEMALSSQSNPLIVEVHALERFKSCAICADERLSASMECIVQAGDHRACALFLMEVAPELAHEDVIAEHMAHGVKNPQDREILMVDNLMTQSYNIARGLGAEYATQLVTTHGRMTVPNRSNIQGFATATCVFTRLLKCKRALLADKSSSGLSAISGQHDARI